MLVAGGSDQNVGRSSDAARMSGAAKIGRISTRSHVRIRPHRAAADMRPIAVISDDHHSALKRDFGRTHELGGPGRVESGERGFQIWLRALRS